MEKEINSFVKSTSNRALNKICKTFKLKRVSHPTKKDFLKILKRDGMYEVIKDRPEFKEIMEEEIDVKERISDKKKEKNYAKNARASEVNDQVGKWVESLNVGDIVDTDWIFGDSIRYPSSNGDFFYVNRNAENIKGKITSIERMDVLRIGVRFEKFEHKLIYYIIEKKHGRVSALLGSASNPNFSLQTDISRINFPKSILDNFKEYELSDYMINLTEFLKENTEKGFFRVTS